MFIALPAFGSTITVTNTNDSGAGSLRAAIAAASPGDTINFNLTYPATVHLSSTLSVGTDLTISGPGVSNLALDGNQAIEVLSISQGVTVGISGMTIENAKASYGGGIYNFGRLTLTDCMVSRNSATYYGGGILNYGQLLLANSTVSGNSSAYYGGGIFSYGTLILANSTVSGNSTTYYGAGIFSSDGTVSLTNSTISGNSAQYYGGGIWNSSSGNLSVASSTVAGNSANDGGDIANYYASLVLKNTVLAYSDGGNCWLLGGTASSDGYNLSDDSTCASFLTSTTDENNSSAGLDPKGLQDNGGPTKTIALLSTSPAVDGIPLADCTLIASTEQLTTDQRGDIRPAGPACDIGAFELGENAAFSSFSAKLDINGGSTPGFDLNSKFSLDAGSSGINPLVELVKLQVGTYSVAVPAGSFHQLRRGAKKGSYVFSGTIGGASLAIQIVPLGGSSYQFKATASPVDLTALTNPVTITLTIGNHTGTTSVYADFSPLGG